MLPIAKTSYIYFRIISQVSFSFDAHCFVTKLVSLLVFIWTIKRASINLLVIDVYYCLISELKIIKFFCKINALKYSSIMLWLFSQPLKVSHVFTTQNSACSSRFSKMWSSSVISFCISGIILLCVVNCSDTHNNSG